MKSVKRYDGKIEHCDNGGYVTFTEYKRLEARLENATGRVCTLAERIAELERDNSMILSGADWMEYLADITRKAFERAEAAEKELAALRAILLTNNESFALRMVLSKFDVFNPELIRMCSIHSAAPDVIIDKIDKQSFIAS